MRCLKVFFPSLISRTSVFRPFLVNFFFFTVLLFLISIRFLLFLLSLFSLPLPTQNTPFFLLYFASIPFVSTGCLYVGFHSIPCAFSFTIISWPLSGNYFSGNYFFLQLIVAVISLFFHSLPFPYTASPHLSVKPPYSDTPVHRLCCPPCCAEKIREAGGAFQIKPARGVYPTTNFLFSGPSSGIFSLANT